MSSVFFEALPFAPDRFQVEAIEASQAGQSVVVTAPTGAGKTLVAEGAIHHALDVGLRAFYTTPLKALSNQKFTDFRAIYGDDQVGLLTGDNSVNGSAPVVVMTTEVLRNMIYSGSEDLESLGVVILDEVHYLQDPARGAVWEEIIIHLPAPVLLVCLSATVSNPEEFTRWVAERRGGAKLVSEEHRPVPLETLLALKDTYENELTVEPVFDEKGRPNARLERSLRQSRNRRRRFRAPRRLETIELLAAIDRLPAIYFIFSRAGCEGAADRVAEGLRLTTPDEARVIREFAEKRTAHLGDNDLAALGYGHWIERLSRGVASHHAGLVPAFKETVEELFARGLVKVVFATETLSLGINMPARTVVIESLMKYNGETHELLRPGDFTQLTGRAGRRGIDHLGTAVVSYSSEVPFGRVAAIASAGTHPLRSSFHPNYNMAVNLVANYSRSQAQELLNASFGQFQSQLEAEDLLQRISDGEADIAAFRTAAECDRGDIWAAMASGDRRSHGTIMRAFGSELSSGDVIDLGDERLVLLARGTGSNPRLLVLSETGKLQRIRPGELPSSATRVGSMELPEPFQPRDEGYQRQVTKELRRWNDEGDHLAAYQGESFDPVRSCPDFEDHQMWVRRIQRIERDVTRWKRRQERLGIGLVGEFEDLMELLGRWGFVDGWALTDRGEKLRHIYNELDVVVVEAVEARLFDGLEPAEMAALASAFVYEPRSESWPEEWPTPALKRVSEDLEAIDQRLAAAEHEAGVGVSRPPESGFAELIYQWARGVDLTDLLDDGLAAGDFVRTTRQLLDLLRQLRDVFPALSRAVSAAIAAIDRGVVAAGGVE